MPAPSGSGSLRPANSATATVIAELRDALADDTGSDALHRFFDDRLDTLTGPARGADAQRMRWSR